jgi:hypothetical protein
MVADYGGEGQCMGRYHTGCSRWTHPQDGICVEVAVVQCHLVLHELEFWLLQDACDSIAMLCAGTGQIITTGRTRGENLVCDVFSITHAFLENPPWQEAQYLARRPSHPGVAAGSGRLSHPGQCSVAAVCPEYTCGHLSTTCMHESITIGTYMEPSAGHAPPRSTATPDQQL